MFQIAYLMYSVWSLMTFIQYLVVTSFVNYHLAVYTLVFTDLLAMEPATNKCELTLNYLDQKSNLICYIYFIQVMAMSIEQCMRGVQKFIAWQWRSRYISHRMHENNTCDYNNCKDTPFRYLCMGLQAHLEEAYQNTSQNWLMPHYRLWINCGMFLHNGEK